jgi:spermidine synthase
MRGLSGVLSASVYSVALVLAATLIGIVAGTAVAVRVVARVERPTRALAIAGGVATIALVLSTVALHALPGLSLALAHATPDPGLRLAGEAVLALLVVLVPSAAIGAVLPLTLAFGDRQDPAEALAAPLAANTAGGIAGALAGAFVLLPLLGLGGGLLAIAATLGMLTAALATSPAARIAAGSMAVALALSAVCGPALPFPWRAGPGEHVLLERDGPTATVLVTSDAQGNRRLRVNGQYALGGDDGLFIERREGVLPVLLHPAPRRLLHLGVGTGDTLGASMTSPGIVADGVELVDDALAVAAVFADQNDDVTHDPRVRLVADDARSVLLASGARWDVIDTDLVLPWTSGAGALFSREFYELGLAHLAAGGLFCQWLPLHQLAVGDLEAIVATFTDVFPRAQMWVAYHRALEPIVALVGSVGPVVVDPPALRRRLEDPRFRTMAGSVGLDDPDDLGLLYVTDGVHLRAAVRDVEPITDDRPRIEFSAPRAYYAQEGLGRAGLAWVAARLDPAPAPVAGPQSATFELRATLLRAELALLDGDRPLELRAYLDALGRAPTSPTVLAALGAIAAERRRAGDVGTADAIARAVSATHAGS